VTFSTQPDVVLIKNSVLTELVEFRQPSLELFGCIVTIILSLFSSAQQAFQTRAALEADRFLCVWLSRLGSGWRSALVLVKPRTVIAWYRKGFRLEAEELPFDGPTFSIARGHCSDP
jgi:hypothetical protein